MPQVDYEFQANYTPYQYIGDADAFGSLTLTMLARSFDEMEIGDLDMLFPAMMIQERSVTIDQKIESHSIMPPAQAGIPNGNYLYPNRIRRATVVPQIFRENDAIEWLYVNQLRAPGTVNTQLSAQQHIAERTREMVNRHRRTKSIFQSKMLLGGWRYNDPRTQVSIDVSSNIPIHNFYSYKGWGGNGATSVAADTDVNIMGRNYRALTALAPTKDRPEAAFFTSTDYKIGVPWTYPQADIVRCLHLLKQWCYKTNKNKPDTIVMNGDLLAVITATNEYLKTWQGFPGSLVMNQPDVTNGVAGNAMSVTSMRPPMPQQITFGPGGDISTIAGMRVVVLDGIWSNPANENKKEVYWPAHKVALVCSKSLSDASATLGYTYHCSAEAPDGSPGLWVRTSDNAPLPAPPAFNMQMGDCFVPFPVYPHWIMQLDVCEPEDLYTSLPILPDLGYGYF
jgi:hypothetical protein